MVWCGAGRHTGIKSSKCPANASPPPPNPLQNCINVEHKDLFHLYLSKYCQAIPPDFLFYEMGIRLSRQLQMRWHFALCWTIDWNQAWVTAGIDENHKDVSLSLIKAAIGTSLEPHTPVPYLVTEEVEILVYHFPTCISWYRIFHTGQGLLSEPIGLDLVWFQIH